MRGWAVGARQGLGPGHTTQRSHGQSIKRMIGYKDEAARQSRVRERYGTLLVRKTSTDEVTPVQQARAERGHADITYQDLLLKHAGMPSRHDTRYTTHDT